MKFTKLTPADATTSDNKSAYPIVKSKVSLTSSKIQVATQAPAITVKATVDKIVKEGWTATGQQYYYYKKDSSDSQNSSSGTITLKLNAQAVSGASGLMATLGAAAVAIAAFAF